MDVKCVALAQHLPVDFPIVRKFFGTARGAWGRPGPFAGKVLWMVLVPCMRDSTGSFDRLAAAGSCTKRFVGFVVMISTMRFAIKNVEGFVRERFLS